jgi:TonB family protein
MTARLAALVMIVIAGDVHTQNLPPRLSEGASVEVCGRVTSFVSEVPARCDATLEVRAADGGSTQVVIPAAIRRLSATAARNLEGGEACFSGVVELGDGVTRVRIPSLAAVRVTKTGTTAGFGAGAVDACGTAKLTSPRVLRDVKPNYTSEAMRARVQGAVVMDVVVDATGAVSDVRVTRSLDPGGLDDEAIKAMRAWTFAPGTLEGQPVAVMVTVEMTFSLRSRR